MPVALEILAANDFQMLLGKDFIIHFSDEVSVTAKLEKVLDLHPHANLERTPFSILFQTMQKDHYYKQAIYSIEQPGLGTMQIFLVPVGCNEKGMQYEAIFS